MAQHSAKGARFQAVTGNTLAAGEVVYLNAQGDWVVDFRNAAIADGETEFAVLLEKATPANAEREVVGIYLFEVLPNGDGFKPASVRETIRAAGPTTHLNFGKQAELGA